MNNSQRNCARKRKKLRRTGCLELSMVLHHRRHKMIARSFDIVTRFRGSVKPEQKPDSVTGTISKIEKIRLPVPLGEAIFRGELFNFRF
jgi:hypothetical protein